MSSSSATGNRTLSRIAAILDSVDGTPTTASELARRSGLSVSTAHRLAVAMTEYGFLRRHDEGTFILGARFLRPALVEAAVPILEALRDRTGETAQLWVRSGSDRVCHATADSRQELRATLPVGTRLPLPAGSSGRLLSHDPDALAQLKAHGWVESVGRRTPGLGSVSAPVRDDRDVVAAVCVAMPLPRVRRSPGADWGTATVEAADLISAHLHSASSS